MGGRCGIVGVIIEALRCAQIHARSKRYILSGTLSGHVGSHIRPFWSLKRKTHGQPSLDSKTAAYPAATLLWTFPSIVMAPQPSSSPSRRSSQTPQSPSPLATVP
jgi:hypothetical protein